MPTFAYGSTASSATWRAMNAPVNTVTISCQGKTCFVLCHRVRLFGWLNTMPSATSKPRSR
jgi:hypothetical protein